MSGRSVLTCTVNIGYQSLGVSKTPRGYNSPIYEYARRLKMRMQRLKELAALSKLLFSRTCHSISNIRIQSL